MDAIECIMNRNSIRRYSIKPVDDQIVRRIIEAGIAAPSGKNGQPWKFKIITERTLIEQISTLSLYSTWMKSASLFVLCFLDNNCSYDYIKDIQSCGAAMQNMLLAAHASGIGGCWVGEILAKAETVKHMLSFNDKNLELMGLLTFGHKTNKVPQSQRRHTDTFLL